MRVAGIDCGTNSIRLLIADVEATGAVRLRDVVRTMTIVRLGQGVDRTHRFAPDALERTLTAVDDFAAQCRAARVDSIRFAATSATRDAENRDEFLDGVEARLGVRPQVLSGAEEAATSFAGALSAMPAGVESPVIAVDLGGGSTELVLGDMVTGEVLASHSMNVGSVRMRERHLRHDPPTEVEVAAARADINAALDEAEQHVPFGAARGAVGLAGTVTSVTARFLGLSQYDADRIHGTALTPGEIAAQTAWFVAASRPERAALGFLAPGRIDVIGSGALVWQEVVAWLASRMHDTGHPLEHVVTSEHDILDGLALWAAREPQSPEW